MSAAADGRWRIGIGDPTFIGWSTAFCYLVVFLFILVVIKREKKDTSRRLWLLLALLMLGLGVNKQLDLQTWLTEFGRDMALQYGWYRDRRVLQIGFVLGLASLCLLSAWGLTRWARFADRYAVRAAWGVALLLVFILMRATSFHHLDVVLGHQLADNVSLNAALELSGVCLVGWAACARLWDVSPKRR